MKISHAQTLIFINAVHLQGISKKTQNEYNIYIIHVAQNGERPNVGDPAVEVAGSYVFDAGCNQ
jgi:hypothetical protein